MSAVNGARTKRLEVETNDRTLFGWMRNKRTTLRPTVPYRVPLKVGCCIHTVEWLL